MKGTKIVYGENGYKKETRKVTLRKEHFIGEDELSVEASYSKEQLDHLHKCIHHTKEILKLEENANRFHEEISPIELPLLKK